ncbi:MAG: 50S ribosomal protein L10 [Firmicutes bacterium]|nr:50S ribosomal protein L10 [Bacillota bacterium]
MSKQSIELKSKQVDEILEKVNKAKGIALLDYRGINVEQDTNMRNQLRAEKVEYKVLKNRLVLRAFNKAGHLGLDKVLEGPTAIAFSYEDATAPARILAENCKKVNKIKLKGGIVEGKILDAAGITAVASIPSKQILLSQLLCVLTSPMRSLAIGINEVAKKKS